MHQYRPQSGLQFIGPGLFVLPAPTEPRPCVQGPVSVKLVSNQLLTITDEEIFMAPQAKAARHHPALVTLHWLLALLLLVALGMGTLVLGPMPLEAPGKVDALRGHMIAGMLIGALMLVRLVVRVFTVPQVAPSPSSGSPAKDALARLVHIGLYVLVFAMAASGMATALLAGLPDIVFGGSGGAIPATLSTLTPRVAHGWIAKGIAALVLLHVLGAVFHQWVRKDGLMSRMWWGPR